MHTIIVPLDGSQLAEHILPHVKTMAPLLGSNLLLLRVVSEAQITGGESWGYALASVYGVPESEELQRDYHDASVEALRQRAQAYLEVHARALRELGLTVATDVRCGSPADTIVQAASECGDDTMIAMATHGYGGLRRWALGSVADKVIHATDAPVLLVRGEAPATVHPPRRILVPLDGSGLAQQALPLARKLAQAARAELILLRAVVPMIEAYVGAPMLGRPIAESSEAIGSLREYALEDLEAQATALRAEIAHVRTHAIIGYPAEVIVDEAREMEVDLIVMATHGYGGLRRWALGSVADKVLHATTTPLILVRASEH